jgi:23S rRNA (adenine2503-C2)-methyltransferase
MIPTGTNIIGLSPVQLAEFVRSMGERPYRAGQIFSWLYTKGATSFDEMSDLGASLRQKLQEVASIGRLAVLAQQRSSHDGTTKFLFGLPDGLKIESVLIPPARAFRGREAAHEDEQKRLTLCISTQVGCPLDCTFCATATMGYARNLTAGEIVGQILEARRLTDRPVTNIVFMGMGEPMMNYDNVMTAIEIITTGMAIAARRITVSTAGWADNIRRMGDEKRRVKLAISLHSADDETRTKLMPINKRYNLAELMAAVEHYYKMTKQRVTYEYIFFDGVNDSDRAVAQLEKLARRVPCKINVIPFHPIDFTGVHGMSASLRPSPRMEAIIGRLRRNHHTVFVRSSAGEDIDAACGQLAVRHDRATVASARTTRHARTTSQPIPLT